MSQAIRNTSVPPTSLPDGMVLIPGGQFTMGADDGYAEEAPAHPVTVGSFAIDTYLVTNREFRRFCDETGRAHPERPRWPGMPDHLEQYPDHPAVNVNYADAAAYAEWIGKRLPTEAEWEFAARGGREHGRFPWGDDPPGGGRAQFATRDTPVPWRDPFVATGFRYTAPVGTFPANAYGLFDMAGNVWEWCDNWFYDYPWQDLDPGSIGEGWGLQRVVRGGAWYSPVQDLRVSRRLRVHGGVGSNGTGFRCVVDIESDDAASATAPFLPPQTAPPPDAWDELIHATPRRMEQGVELCLGCGPALTDEDAARVRDLGFTSVEQYVHWGTVENDGEGSFDFTHWDEQVEILKRHGLKWVPFLIAGPAYSLSDWFRELEEMRGAVCLEHRLPSKIQSVFDRSFDRHIDRFLGAFAEQYHDADVIESLLLGITGDFGEAIYPVTGTAWTQVTPGPYHTHPGYWCGDPIAEAHFRETMLARYNGDLSALNAAWGTSFPAPQSVELPMLKVPEGIEAFRTDEPTPAGVFPIETVQDRRRWLDFIDWYRGAMLTLAEIWMTTTRRHFPEHPIYLCTGGDAPPNQGAHFGDQCRIAAAVGGGVRITNEASNYGRNFGVTRWVTSAGRFYGAYTGIEPAGGVNEYGVTCRIFNTTVSGSKNLHFYAANITHHRETVEAWQATFDQIRIEQPVLDIAFFYPDTAVMLGDVTTASIGRQVARLRDLTDLEYVDDAMSEGGVLDRFRVLILARCPVIERATLDRIDAWLASGGVLLMVGNDGIESVEGDSWVPDQATGKVVQAAEFMDDADRDREVAAQIREGLAVHGVTLIDGQLDNVFVSRVEGRLLVLNHSAEELNRELHLPDGSTREITLPANSISTVPL